MRFWHDRGMPLSRREAMRICLPDRLSRKAMAELVDTLLTYGLADRYSSYVRRNILDGGGYGLTIVTVDGYAWSWGTLNAYPEGCGEIRDAIRRVLLGIRDEDAPSSPDWRNADGDLGRTDVAHLYRIGWQLRETHDGWRMTLCRKLRQDLLLYRRTHGSKYEYAEVDYATFYKIVRDSRMGRAYQWKTSELIGAIGYIVDHDDVGQKSMEALACDGTITKILCSARVRDKAAPNLRVAGWDI